MSAKAILSAPLAVALLLSQGATSATIAGTAGIAAHGAEAAITPEKLPGATIGLIPELAAELAKLWAKDLPTAEDKTTAEKNVPVANHDALIIFRVVKKKNAWKINSDKEAMEIYRSSGVKEIDEHAIKCLKKAHSFSIGESKESKMLAEVTSQYMAVFKYEGKLVAITLVPAPDFATYMAAAQRQIKRNWFPPREEQSKSVSCKFTIKRDGTITDVKTVRNRGSEMCRLAAEEAIKHASPLPRLPLGSPESVDVDFTFDYNVFNRLNQRFQNIGRPGPLSDDQLGKYPLINVQLLGENQPAEGAVKAHGEAVDLGAYLQETGEKIKKTWKQAAPDREDSRKTDETLTAHIKKDGQISYLHLDRVTGDNGADTAVLAAVRKAAPFGPLPQGADEIIQVKIQLKADTTGGDSDKAAFNLTQQPLKLPSTPGKVPKAPELFFPKLSLMWTKNTLKGEKNEVWLKLHLNSAGALDGSKGEPAIVVYNTSKNSELDRYAEDCIKRAAPFDLADLKNIDGTYMAKFDVKKMTAFLTAMPQVDWHGYLANVQRNIGKRWHPPGLPGAENIVVTFRLKSDGTISDLKTNEEGSPANLHGYAGTIVEGLVPFWPFPGEAPDAVNLQITFINPAAREPSPANNVTK
ncbi:MAG: TonB C-terminal domain-containing protein [Cyanobacteria bacterium SZAS LIN-3]|nr:TonB C-terminal domain-containing protein [Cyanobacteria bacterium SZAS LIN-3]